MRRTLGRVRIDRGDLYWIESNSVPQWSLVSAGSDGRDRYRITLPGKGVRAFVVSAAKVMLAQGTTIQAYDTATGAPSWTVDMAAAFPGSSAVSGFVDLGNGRVAISLDSGLYFVDIASGKVVWSRPGPKDGFKALTSDGAGSLAVSAAAGGSAADYFVLDSTGVEKWRQRIDGARGPAPWVSDVPWIPTKSAQGISPSAQYVAVPWSWSGWVGGTDLAFSLFPGTAAMDPITVQLIRNEAVVAAGPLPNEISFHPFSSWPFLAGKDAGHLVLVGQSSHDAPGLCFPVQPGQPWVARVDGTSITQCPLTGLGGTLWVGTAALTPGRLIAGGVDMLSFGCGAHNVYTIAAFALPGESLAPSGWVQNEGNPGLGSRRQRP